MRRMALFVVLLMVNLCCVDAANDMMVCYILDGILIAYSIVLTVLYIRLKLYPLNKPQKPDEGIYAKPDAGVYTGLSPRVPDTYETIRLGEKADM